MVPPARTTVSLPLLMGLSILIVDQGLKGWVLRTLIDGTLREPIPGVLRLMFVRNTGMAFGLFHWLFCPDRSRRRSHHYGDALVDSALVPHREPACPTQHRHACCRRDRQSS